MKQPPLSTARIQDAIVASGFGNKALAFVFPPRFQEAEVNYKLRLASRLSLSQEALRNDDPRWIDLLRKAINSKEDNIINWRLRKPFLDWCKTSGTIAKTSIRDLWIENRSLDQRIRSFSASLKMAGFSQPGEQLCIASVLLMTTDAIECPPVRARVLSKALRGLGLPKLPTATSVSERYQTFISILDGLIQFSEKSSRTLKNRLEAQGATWCATGGWPGIQLPLDLESIAADFEKDAERDIAAAAQELSNLAPTEKSVLVSARRGQGQYRKKLLRLWKGCAISGCTSENLLRASHLKPWRLSTNPERLDSFNGLLLTPNLDLALDRCLIAFSDTGEIILGSDISSDDAKALGLSRNLRLRFVRPEHQRYLEFHRGLFNKREALVAPR